MAADANRVREALLKSQAAVSAGLVMQEVEPPEPVPGLALGIPDAVADDETQDYNPDDPETRELAPVEPAAEIVSPEPPAPAPITEAQFSAAQLEQIRQADYVNKLLSEQPDVVAKYALERLTPEQRAALFGPAPDATPDPYLLSDADTALLNIPERIAYENRKSIAETPKRFATLEQTTAIHEDVDLRHVEL